MLSSPRKLQAVIFDCDGVLVDTEPVHYRAFQAVLEPLGLGFDYDRYMEAYIGFDDRDAFAEAFREADRTVEDGHLLELIEAKNHILFSIVAQGLDTFPGVVPLIRALQGQNVPLAVASGALRSEVQAFIRALGVEDAFSVIVAADDVSRSKPDPETYVKAMDRMRDAGLVSELAPGRIIAIEDTPAGIASAGGAGLCVIAVTNSFGEGSLRKADLVVQSLTEVSPAAMEQIIERISA